MSERNIGVSYEIARGDGLPKGLARALSGVRIAIFDFDGTLAYTQSGNFFAYARMFDERGIHGVTEREYEDRTGGTCEEHVRHIASCHGVRLADDEIHAMARQFDDMCRGSRGDMLPPAFEYVRGTLAALGKGVPKVIVTGNRIKNVSHALKEWRLVESFASLVGVGRKSSRFADKKSAYQWLLAAGASQHIPALAGERPIPIPAPETVVFEDSPWALETARALGMRTVAVLHRGNCGMRVDDWDAVIDAVAESETFCERYRKVMGHGFDSQAEREIAEEKAKVTEPSDTDALTIEATYGELVRMTRSAVARAIARAETDEDLDPDGIARRLVDKMSQRYGK